MKVISCFALVFVVLLLVNISESRRIFFKIIPLSPGFLFGTFLGSVSTILYNFAISESDTPNKNVLDHDIFSSSNFKFEKKEITFLNLIGSPETVNNSIGQYTDDTELSDILAKQIRVLCFILTHPANHLTRARTVRKTWGKRCTVFYFVSTQPVVLDDDLSVSTVVYEGEESLANLWPKTKTAFKHAYDEHFDDADWFLKADDDSYMVMENLRLFLLDKDPLLPIYFGNRIMGESPETAWIGGGSGYILSKEALRRFAEEAFDSKSRCNKIGFGLEDLEMGRCLTSVNVKVGDSRDPEGKPRFQHTILDQVLNPRHMRVSKDFLFTKDTYIYGENCCSDSIIGMHYLNDSMMRILEFIIYKVHPFGINPKLSGVKQKDEILLYLKNKTVKSISKNINPKFPILL